MADTEERPIVPLESLDEETRQKVLSARRDIKIVAGVAIGMIIVMMVLVFVGVALAFSD